MICVKELEDNNMVEWKELGDFLNFEQPTPYLVKSTEYDNSYKTPVLTAGQSLLLGYTNETDGIYEADKDNPCIIFDDFTTSFHWIDFPFKVKSSAMKMLKPKKNTIFRYVYYAMQQIQFVPQQHQRHWISKYSHFTIPIPSLDEQKRIVGILDTFTDSIENLKQQIAQRRKQFEFYRDQLLDLEGKEGVEMKLQDIAQYRRGSFPQPYGNREWYDGEGAMPFVQVADVEESGMRLKKKTKQFISQLAMPKSVFVPKGTVIVTLQGSIGKVAINQYDVYVDRTLAIFEKFIIEMNKKYFAYQLERIFSIKKEKARGGTIKTITKEEFSAFVIPVPPLSEQSRIVSILDTFEASISNLEAQLEQRQKQYEYYRNQLLTFE